MTNKAVQQGLKLYHLHAVAAFLMARQEQKEFETDARIAVDQQNSSRPRWCTVYMTTKRCPYRCYKTAAVIGDSLDIKSLRALVHILRHSFLS
jgi:hypothetical protein